MLAGIDDVILKFANLLLNLEKLAQWPTSQIQPIPKTGELSEVGNYRGVALSPIAAKIANKMLLNHIQPILDPLLIPTQNGFRPGRSTSQILALRRIIESVKSHSLQAAIIFDDFKKAFDSIHRHKMLEILRKCGVPRKLVDAIGKFYESTFASVLSPNGETDLFQIQAGVLQGDTLAPLFFVLIVDYAMRQAIDGHVEQLGFEITHRKSQRHPTIKVADMLFADDVALLPEEVHSVLLYNSDTWSINKSMQKIIDGCYTRMLRMATNASWKEKTTNEVLYQDLQPLSQTIRERRLRLAGTA